MKLMKTSQSDGLRKAAILVASLDQAAADAVLDSLTPEQARQVRGSSSNWTTSTGSEQRRVIDEFFRVGPLLPAKCPPGIELDGRLAGGWPCGRQRKTTIGRRRRCAAGGRARRALPLPPGGRGRQAGPRLAGERPQTIALVLSHLPPAAGRGRAGAAAGGRAGRSGPPAGRSGRDRSGDSPRGGRGPRSRGSRSKSEMQRRRVAGLAAVAGILQATDGRDRHADPRQPGQSTTARWPRSSGPGNRGLRRPGRRWTTTCWPRCSTRPDRN